jgi:aminoglycoside 3-N-acetyltransferase
MHSEASLTADLVHLAVPRGGILVVHSGYKSLGDVDGGPSTVVRALRAAVGGDGTVLVPTFTTDLIDPYTWPVPPLPGERERLLEEMPYFDATGSPSHKMGAIAETLWHTPGARRSAHPVTSWAGLGPEAEALTREHPLDDPEGIDGPVGRALRGDATVLLLGVTHDANTTIHLAESLLDMPHLYALPDRYPVRGPDGRREWRPITKTTKCSDGFVKIEELLGRSGAVRRGRVGNAPAQLLRSRDIVAVAVGLLASNPVALLCDDPECVHCPTSRDLLRTFHADAEAVLASIGEDHGSGPT